jgi:YegS/Rv2252/BmrU family lipid kinase
VNGLFFVVNEHAGNGKGRRVFRRIRPNLEPQDEFATTAGPGDGRRLAIEAVRSGRRIVVAVGGDGTANEVVNGLADTGFDSTLGILPAGGGNDLPWVLGIPRDTDKALALLRSDKTRTIDVGLVSFGDERRPRYYANVFGMGLSGEIAALARGENRLGSAAAYMGNLLLRMMTVRPRRFRLSTEGGVVSQRAIAAHVANGRREGSMFPVAPDAQLDDGLLDLVTVDDVPRLGRPWYAVTVLRGRLMRQRNVTHRLVESAEIEAVNTLPCHLDGEPFRLEPGQKARVEVRKAALRVIALDVP